MQLLGMVVLVLAGPVLADDMTRMAQENLEALGYDPGPVDGELGDQTAVTISKFQAENNMEITGEVTPQLLGVLSARVDQAASAEIPELQYVPLR